MTASSGKYFLAYFFESYFDGYVWISYADFDRALPYFDRYFTSVVSNDTPHSSHVTYFFMRKLPGDPPVKSN